MAMLLMAQPVVCGNLTHTARAPSLNLPPLSLLIQLAAQLPHSLLQHSKVDHIAICTRCCGLHTQANAVVVAMQLLTKPDLKERRELHRQTEMNAGGGWAQVFVSSFTL